MDEQQSRQITVLAALLLILLGAVYYWEPATDVDGDDLPTVSVWEVPRDQVAQLRVEGQRRADVLLFEDQPEGWYLRQPEDALADPIHVDGLLYTVTRIEEGEAIPDADPADFGLAPEPQLVVTAILADGSEQRLEIGDASPIGNKTYVRSADGGVAVVTGDLLEKLTPVYDKFKDKQLLHLEPGKVRSVTLEAPEGTLHLASEGGDWWLEGFARADLDAVDDLVLAALDMRLDSFLDAGALAGGIDAPRYTLTLVEEGDRTQVVRVGEQTPEGVLVEVEGGPVGFAPPAAFTFLTQGPRDVGAKTAIPWKEGKVSRVEGELDGQSFALTKEDDGWTVASPEGADADALVGAVRALVMDYRSDPVPALSESWGRITVHRDDLETDRVVLLGQREGSSWRVAKDEAGGGTFLVPVGEIEALAALLAP